jgi:8-oxo-dGTP diphosphatase
MMTAGRRRVSAYALIRAQGQVLLSLVNRHPFKGLWSLPGGGAEFGEMPLQTLARELMEEAALALDCEPELIAVFSDTYSLPRSDGVEEPVQAYRIVYRADLPGIVPCKMDGDGDSSDGCCWFPLNALPHNLSYIVSSALARVSG